MHIKSVTFAPRVKEEKNRLGHRIGQRSASRRGLGVDLHLPFTYDASRQCADLKRPVRLLASIYAQVDQKQRVTHLYFYSKVPGFHHFGPPTEGASTYTVVRQEWNGHQSSIAGTRVLGI